MPDERMSKSSPQPQKKKKVKNKKKQKADRVSSKDSDHLHPAASAPPVLPSMGPPLLPKLKSSPKKDAEKSSRRSKKSLVTLLSMMCKSGGSPTQSFLSQLSAQARESVRWEGALDEPRDEEERLELYRANRRLRYIRHKETQLKEVEQKNM